MDCLYKVWILYLSEQSWIEHIQSTDLGNPWIAQHIQGFSGLLAQSTDLGNKWVAPYPRIESSHAIANALAVCLGKKSVQN